MTVAPPYLRHSFALPPRKYVGILACQRDPLLRSLDTEVLDCALSVVPPPPSGKKGAKGVQTVAAPEWEVILMDTVIFPEGGGQPSDVGTLTFVNEGVSTVVKVRQVLRRGLEAVHFCDAPIEVGSLVTAALDWDRRADLMSMHTGQHLLSGVFDTLDLPTLSWSLTPSPQPCYIELPRVPTAGEIAQVQRRCNEFIQSDARVSVEMELVGNAHGDSSGTDAGAVLPDTVPKDYVGGVLRTVEIVGLGDRNPCCGTHSPSLAFLSSIYILPGTSSIRGTNSRLYFLAGPRVLLALASSLSVLKETTVELGCQSEEVAERVRRLGEGARDGKKREARLREELAELEAEKLCGSFSTQLSAAPASVVKALMLREGEDDGTNSIEFLNLVSSALAARLATIPSFDPVTTPYLLVLACSTSSPPSLAAPNSTATTGTVLISGHAELVIKGGKSAQELYGSSIKGGGKGRWQGKLLSPDSHGWRGIDAMLQGL